MLELVCNHPKRYAIKNLAAVLQTEEGGGVRYRSAGKSKLKSRISEPKRRREMRSYEFVDSNAGKRNYNFGRMAAYADKGIDLHRSPDLHYE